MVEISCFKGIYNNYSVNFIFIQFKNYVKVILDSKSIILTNIQLVSNIELFQIYKLSLLCTKNTSNIATINKYNFNKYKNDYIYGILTKRNWAIMGVSNDYCFVPLQKSPKKNPLNMKEPKRSSSDKKIRKFSKLLNVIFNNTSIANILIHEFYMNESKELMKYFNNYIEYELHLNILLSIYDKYGCDIMTSISQYV